MLFVASPSNSLSDREGAVQQYKAKLFVLPHHQQQFYRRISLGRFCVFILFFGRLKWNLIFLTSLLTNKPMLFIFKKYIECSKGAINAGNILLKIRFIFIAELFMSIDILFKYS